jgi:hypothetical protein
VITLDLENQRSNTLDGYIQLWTGIHSDNCSVCQVIVSEKVNIPAQTSMWVTVDVPNKNFMSTVLLL